MEREIIRKIIIEGQEFVNEIPLIKRPFFFILWVLTIKDFSKLFI